VTGENEALVEQLVQLARQLADWPAEGPVYYDNITRVVTDALRGGPADKGARVKRLVEASGGDLASLRAASVRARQADPSRIGERASELLLDAALDNENRQSS
jgi:hypothetical protein